MDTYLTRYAGNYFYTDESLIIYNDNNESGFNKSTYQLLYYNQIFADLLKSKPTATKLLSVWDSVYAYSSKDYATPIDYNFFLHHLVVLHYSLKFSIFFINKINA